VLSAVYCAAVLWETNSVVAASASRVSSLSVFPLLLIVAMMFMMMCSGGLKEMMMMCDG